MAGFSGVPRLLGMAAWSWITTLRFVVGGALALGCGRTEDGSTMGTSGTGGSGAIGGSSTPGGSDAIGGSGGAAGAMPTVGLGVPGNVISELGWSLRDDTPAGKNGVSLVVDGAADRLIVFGGRGTDVWSLPLAGANENRWVRLFPEGEAPPRSEPVSVYDPVQNRVLSLLNAWDGMSEDYDQVQLWELTLTGTPRWRHLQPAGTSPGREVGSGVLALDRANNRLFALGDSFGRAGTWSLSLSENGEWTRLADAPAGFGVSSSGLNQFLVFDEPRQRLVAFGYSEVWELPVHGGEWTSLGRYPCLTEPLFAAPAFDEAGERVIYAGGECRGVQTFSLASNEWQGTVGPSSDFWPESVFGTAAVDVQRERILYAFRGLPPATSNETLQMSLTTLELEPLTPNTRGVQLGEGSTLVWDPTRAAVVAFGGQQGRTFTHALSAGATWRALPGALTTSGWGASAIHDPTRSAIVGFAGSYHTDTVFLLASKPGAAWEPLAASEGPEPRLLAASVYDSTKQRVLIHGGTSGPMGSRKVLDETWALSLNDEPSWTKLTASGEGPGARAGELSVYDPVGQRFIVYGGTGDGAPQQDLHALSLAGEPEWSRLEASGTVPQLDEPAAVYDAKGRRILFISVGYFGVVAAALELGEKPSWHTFCSLGTQPPTSPIERGMVVVVPDGLFVAAANAAYRFDLATPYCD